MTPPASDHFNGKTFFQPGAHLERLFRDFLRWRFTSRRAPWPRTVALSPQPPPPTPRGSELVATWLGHATYLLQTTQGNLLFDPVFSRRVSPFTWIGPRRVHPVPIPISGLPEITAVCVSHDHYDHCDVASIRQLADRFNPVFIAPLRHHALLAAAGASRIVELDWWQTERLTTGAEVTLTPTKHWSNRLGTPRNHRLWGGFHIRIKTTPQRTVWFVGDSGYDQSVFREIRARCGAPDLAFVPIGAYEPRWFMAPMHMNPTEAVQLHRDIGAGLSLAMHWGTFHLTDEARDAPVQELREAMASVGVGTRGFRVPGPGESVVC
jgi:L-ascorbate metabolism protein UlaG (beta-lactamase superfamily)